MATNQNQMAQIRPSDNEDDVVEIDLFQLIQAVLKRWKLCATICGGAIALGLVYCFTATPMYQANCRMLLEQGKLNISQIQNVYTRESEGGNNRKDFITTQIQLITSDNILKRVYDHFKFAEKPAYANAVEPLKILEKKIEIKQVPNTSILDLGFKDPDPKLSADVTNYIAREFINDANSRMAGFSAMGLNRMTEELHTMEKNRLDAIKRINDFKQKNDILSMDMASRIAIERANHLHSQQFSTRQSIISQETTLNAIREWKQSGRKLDNLPEFFNKGMVSQLKSQRIDAQASLIRTMQDLGPAHKRVATQRQVIALIDKAIDSEIENILASMQAGFEKSKRRLAVLDAEVAKADAHLKSIQLIHDEYKLLADNLSASEGAYRKVLHRVTDLTIANSADTSMNGSFQVIVPAVPPARAAYPQKAKIMIIVALASGVLSVLICVMLELLDASVKNRQDVEKASRVPVFGTIPFVGDAKDGRVAFVSYEAPKSAAAEAFRGLRTSLSLSALAREARLIAITSAAPGEGRTFAALNLATSYAKAGKRVLLVDCDMRSRRLTSLVSEAQKENAGLSSLLAGTIGVEKLSTVVRKPFADLPLEFLPSGPLAPNAAELLAGEQTSALFEMLARSYDIVIIDTAPVLSVSDTPILAAVPDMNFLIMGRLYQTQKKDLTAAVNTLAGVNGSIIGTIMLQNEGADAETLGAPAGARRTPWYKRILKRA